MKNRLALRALAEMDLPDIAEYFRGPTGLVLGTEDPVIPAKTLKEFARENDDRPTLKVGVVQDRIVAPEEILRLADLPPREELLGSIAGSLTAPVSGMVSVLNGLIRDITYMIGEVAKASEAAGAEVAADSAEAAAGAAEEASGDDEDEAGDDEDAAESEESEG